jgi:four helix bundle protein
MANEFNLNERLVKFSTTVVKISQRFPKIPAANHIADQIARSGLAPTRHYAEAQGAESPKDFIHKMKVGLKELRETFNSLSVAKQMCWLPEADLDWVLNENDQLIAIFFTSIRTAQINNGIDLTQNKDKNNPKDNDENKIDENENEETNPKEYIDPSDEN